MKCPLRYIETHYPDEQIGRDQLDCLKEECAWWRGDIEMCAIKDLSIELGYTQMRLADIKDRMPKDLAP